LIRIGLNTALELAFEDKTHPDPDAGYFIV
jgi:hypothetical protein